MTDSKIAHTPGPWEYEDDEVFAGPSTIAKIGWRPNGPLIAAAPEMREALEQAHGYIRADMRLRNIDEESADGDTLRRIRAALAKAGSPLVSR